jgi:ABC-type transport system involved in Fe-S cluster assembly fused permease/ATPase subunit
MYSILDLQEHLGDRPDARALPVIRGQVEFENVRFHYEGAPRPILNGISFRAEPGETIAIVGPSGSGKTTLTSLLMRFCDPCEGTVRIDGIDLRSVKQGSLRRHIGVVLQEPVLFNDTVRANIAYGRPEATLPEIVAAAEAANAHCFHSSGGKCAVCWSTTTKPAPRPSLLPNGHRIRQQMLPLEKPRRHGRNLPPPLHLPGSCSLTSRPAATTFAST